MYSERTSTGINLIDLTDRQAGVIRDSLRRAKKYCILWEEERRIVDLLIRRIDAVSSAGKEKNVSLKKNEQQ